MKRYKYIFSFCLAVIFGAYLFTGCTKDEMIKGEEEKPLLSIVAGVSETVGTRAEDSSNANLAWIENMTIFLFTSGASDDSKPLLAKTSTIKGQLIASGNQGNVLVLTGKDLRNAKIGLDAEVDIYAIANYIPVNAAQLTKNQVMELSVPRPIFSFVGPTKKIIIRIPMSGIVSKCKLSDIPQKAEITLRRANICVDLKVVDGEYQTTAGYQFKIEEVKLYNDYLNTYLWNEGIPKDTPCRVEKDAEGNRSVVYPYDSSAPNPSTGQVTMNGGLLTFNYPFIGNCNEPSAANPDPTNKITMKLTGYREIKGVKNPFEHTIELKRADGTFIFNRNTALNVTITLKAKGYETNVEVVPWNVDTENSDIDPIGIRFVDTDMPIVIPKDGAVDAKFNFYNPANIPFELYAFEGEARTGAELNKSDPEALLQQVAVKQLVANATTATRKVSFWYKYDDDIWVDTGVRATQQGEEIVAITQPKANSYMVAPSTKPILIPVSQVLSAAAPGIGADEVLTPEMIWTDVIGASKKGLSADAAVAAIEVLGAGPDALLMVTPGSQMGNAVIAVKNAAGVVKWSWHIWVTDYDAEQETGQNTIGGYIFMDRNLGAKTATGNATGVDVIGNYYQQSRKDPFPTKNNASGFITVYDAEGKVKTITASVATTSGLNQIQNPSTFGNATGYPSSTDLWGTNGNKTVNDPCPAGWRVPTKNAFADLIHAVFPNDASTWGREGAHTGYFPYTYYKDVSGNFNGTKLIANWTSTACPTYHTTNSLVFRVQTNASFTFYSWGRANGHPVRCVRDWNKGKAEKEIRVLSAGNYSVSTAHQLGTHAVNTGWSSGIVNILNQNFGKGDPVDVFFKHYNYYNGGYGVDGKDYDIIDLLATHEIDVLYLPWNGDQTSPTADQSKKIVGWLDADPNRVLIVATEFTTQHDMLMDELGFTPHTYSQEGLPSVLAGGNSTIYNAMTDGKYGKLTGTAFANILGNGWITRAEIDRNGYVPILTRQGDASKVTMSVSTTRRVLLIGDTNWFDPGNALGGAGSLSYKGFGEYPILLANAWAWIAEVVTTK